MRFSRGLSLSKQRAPIQEGKIFREIPQQRGKIPRSRFQLLGARAAAGGRGCRGVGRKFDSHHIRSALLGSFFFPPSTVSLPCAREGPDSGSPTGEGAHAWLSASRNGLRQCGCNACFTHWARGTWNLPQAVFTHTRTRSLAYPVRAMCNTRWIAPSKRSSEGLDPA